MEKTKKRIEWIDQVRGLSIFLVVYGHNFPVIEEYIYTFHVPLFFLISGLFHPVLQSKNLISKRFKSIMVPYFLWSSLLFLFWLFLGRFYGDSLEYNLYVFKNFIGIFYAQGGRDYMDWGIPMWFLPTIFLTFISFYFIRKIRQLYLQLIVLGVFIGIGFMLPNLFHMHFFWSFDVALVALVFYSLGFCLYWEIYNSNISSTFKGIDSYKVGAFNCFGSYSI